MSLATLDAPTGNEGRWRHRTNWKKGPGVPCPQCGAPSGVWNTRRSRVIATALRRTRRCKKCDHRFYTMEQVEQLEVGTSPAARAVSREFLARLMALDPASRTVVRNLVDSLERAKAST